MAQPSYYNNVILNILYINAIYILRKYNISLTTINYLI